MITSSTRGGPSGSPSATALTNPDGDAATRRDNRFAEGIGALRAAAGAFRFEERLLMVLGGVLVPMGAIVILLGWWGAAHSPYVFDQIPYVVSGGILGVGMVFLGGFLYFTHWITQLVKDSREQAAELLQAFQRIEENLAAPGSSPSGNGMVPAQGAGHRAAHDPLLVATARGTMAHQPSCAVVAGKSGLRRVSATDGLAICKLCGPA